MKFDRRWVLGGGLTAGLGLAASSAAAKTHVVTMNPATSKFEPASLTVRRNDTVEWRNTTSVLHTVTCDPAAAKVADNVSLPQGAEPFDSGRMRREETFSYKFTKAGTYKYICKYHENMGMTGVVVVK